MQPLEQIALAGLGHDLPALLALAGLTPTAAAQRVLALVQSPAYPEWAALLAQAEHYARPADSPPTLQANQPLQTIFSLIQRRERPENPPTFYPWVALPATAAEAARWEQLFPVAAPPAAGFSQHVAALARQLDGLGREVDLTRFDRVYPHLLALLGRYGWCLASHSPDMSLLDHARLTSAIAACLYAYHQADLSMEAVEAGQAAPRFCLLAGDLSGIQDYIFAIATIGPGGVARRLRARSFYLSVLADGLSYQLVRRFDLPLANVIMASGGKFYLLLPNLAGLESRLAGLRAEIDRWFRKQFNAEIALNLAHVCFSGDRFQAGSQERPGFGDLTTELSGQLNREKRRAGHSGLVDEAGQWQAAGFMLKPNFWGASICQSCGKFPGDQDGNLCRQCERDARIGSRLPRTRYVAFYDDASGELPLPLGASARVLAGDELAEAGQPALLTQLNNPDLTGLAGYPASFRYLANHIPVGPFGAPLTFDKIAAQAQGRSLLGYLKADVDYLGLLFAQGLRRDGGGYDTAAHTAALSRQLDFFFSGWMQHLLSRAEPYQSFYTIFSGGDDLFLVGPWDKAAQLACTINDRLAAFSGGNPDLTLSAGILLTHHSYPISRAAADAEAVLEHSKERPWTDAEGQPQTRSQLTVLDETLAWADAPAIFGEVERLAALSGHLTSAFLYDLVEYGQLYRQWQAGQAEAVRYKAMFAYNIARNLRKGSPELYRWADSLLQSLSHSPGQPASLTMRHLSLIATYLLFSRREKHDER